MKFLSLYGRDGAVMQFVAAIELGNKAGGIRSFNLVNRDGERHPVYVGNSEQLGKHAGRLPRQNLFGPLSQMWIYDSALQQLDRANRIGWVVHRASASKEDDMLSNKAWQMIQRLSPVALRDHWRGHLVEWCLQKQAIESLGDGRYPVIGDVRAMRVSISDYFVKFVSDGVREGLLEL